MTEVYINDLMADLDEEETVTASYGNVSFGAINKRKGIKSNTWNLPFSQRNKLIYDGAEVQGSFSDKPYRRGVIRVEIEGIIVFEGWCMLNEAQYSYEVLSFSGASDFFNSINNLKLSDLDLSEFDHIWNESSIRNSWTNTKGYMYAYVDYGKEWPSDVLNQFIVPPDYMLPQIFFHTVIKQIAIDLGYELY